jgi:hypothetical protein
MTDDEIEALALSRGGSVTRVNPNLMVPGRSAAEAALDHEKDTKKRKRSTGYSEAQFTKEVIAEARSLGWLTAHFRPAMCRDGRWITAVQGDGKGFPDLVLVREARLIFAELKVGNNKLSPSQRKWKKALERAEMALLEHHGFLVYRVFYPSDWPEIMKMLA